MPTHAATPRTSAQASHAGEPPNAWTIGIGTGGLGATGGYLSDGLLQGRVALTEHLDGIVAGRIGHLYVADGADEAMLALAAGLGTTIGCRERTHVRLAVLWNHVHTATLDSWMDTPAANSVGDSAGGVMHRNGAELTVGASLPLQTTPRGGGLRLDADAVGRWLPSHDTMRWSAGARVGLALRI